MHSLLLLVKLARTAGAGARPLLGDADDERILVPVAVVVCCLLLLLLLLPLLRLLLSPLLFALASLRRLRRRSLPRGRSSRAAVRPVLRLRCRCLGL